MVSPRPVYGAQYCVCSANRLELTSQLDDSYTRTYARNLYAHMVIPCS